MDAARVPDRLRKDMRVWRQPWVRRGAAACVLLLVIALFVAHSGFVRSRVRDRAIAYARDAYGIDARIGHLSYNLFTLDVTLNDVTLAPVDRPDQPFLTADRLRVDLPWRAVTGSLALQNIEADRPRVTLAQAADGTLNLPTPPSSAASSSSLNQLPLDRVALNDGAVSFRDATGSLTFAAGGLTLVLAPAPADGIGGALAPGQLHLRTASGETTGVLTGGLAFDGRALRLDDIRITAPEGDMRSSGQLVLLDKQPSVALKARGTLDGAALARWAGLQDLTGRATVDAEVNGPFGQPAFRASVSSDRLTYQGIDATSVRVQASGNASAVDVSSLQMTVAGGRVDGGGHLVLADAATSAETVSATPGAAGGANANKDAADVKAANRASLRWTDVDVDRLLRGLAVTLPAPLRARAGGTLNLQWDTLDRLAGTLTSDLRAPDEGLSGRARLAMADGRWTLDHAHRFSGVALDGDARGVLAKSSLLDSTLTGDARLVVARLADLQSTLTRAGVALPAALRKDIEGDLRADAVLSGTIGQPAAALRVDARDVRSPDLPGQTLALKATGDVTRARANVRQLTASAGRNELAASGTYAFAGAGRFSSQFTATLRDLATLARLTSSTSTSSTNSADATPVVAGDATITGSASGTIAHPVANVTLAARDLVYDDIAIGQVDGTVALANDVATLNARAPDHRASAQGTIGIASPYRLNVTVDAANTDLARLIPPAQQKTLPPVAGTLTARFVITGPLADTTALAIDADLRQFAATVDRTPIALRQPARVQYASRRISADALDLTIGADSRVTVAGAIREVDAGDDGLTLTVDAALQDIEPFLRLARPAATPAASAGGAASAAKDDLPLALRGRITGSVAAAGSLARPRLSGDLQLRDATAAWADLPPVAATGRVALADGIASLSPFNATWQGATLTATGAFPLRVLGDMLPAVIRDALPASADAATLDARLDNATLDLLAAFIDRDRLAGSSGTIAVTLQARTRGVTLNDVDALVTVTDGAFTLAGVPIRQAEPTRVSVANGIARVDAFRWTSNGTQLTGAGTVRLTAPSPLFDLALTGGLDLRIASAFAREISTGGRADLDLRVTGTAETPSLLGSLRFVNGELRLQEPRMIVAGLTGGIRFDGTRLITDNLRGTANGGPITIDGSIATNGFTLGDGRLALTGRGIGLEYPKGLETESNVDLVATLADGVPTLAGKVTVVNGSYRDPLLLSGQLFSSSRPGGIATTASSEESLLSQLQLNIAVVTQRDLRVDNNYGKLGLGADLRVVGTIDTLALLGRAEIREGGQVYLAGNTYTVRTGRIDFANQSFIEPELDIGAETNIQGFPIEVAVSGTPTTLETAIRSMNTSAISDAEATSLLLTGRRGGSSDPEDYGRQIAQALSGEFFGVAGRAIGLDTLRITTNVETSDLFVDPTLIASETDPTSRLTLGKRLNRDVEIVFSQDLGSSRFTWLTHYTGPWRLSAQAVLRDDRSRSYEIKHEPRLGRRPPADRPRRARAASPRIAAVRFSGATTADERQMDGITRLDTGDRFTFTAWQDDRERVERFFHDRGFLEARVAASRDEADPVTLSYEIAEGPKTVLEVEGFALPASVRERIAQRWKTAMFDGFLQQDTEHIVRGYMASVDHPRAAVKTTVDTADGTKTLRVRIEAGPTIADRAIVFDGNSAIASDRLQAVVDERQLALAPWLDPKALADALTQLYRSEGLLAAKVTVGEPTYTGVTARTLVRIQEGAAFVVGRVRADGEPPSRPANALTVFGVASGSRYEPVAIERGRRAVEASYRESGYLSARVEIATAVDAKNARVDVALTVRPGSQSVLTDIIVQGGGGTSQRLVSRTLKLDLNAPVQPAALVAARRRLYDLNVFRRVDVETEPVPGTSTVASAAGAPVPVIARVTLEEIPHYSLRYGFVVNDVADDITGDREYSTGVAADLRNRNILGRAMSGGVFGRYQQNQQIGRLFISTPRFFGLPLVSSAFVEGERTSTEETIEGRLTRTTTNLTAFSLEQRFRPRRTLEIRYSYRFERSRTLSGTDDAPFDITATAPRLQAAVVIDRRNDPFNPTAGWFASQSVEYSSPELGSDLDFIKGFTQFQRYARMGRGVVLVSSARIGLARPLADAILVPNERFRAGGGTTVRGYREDSLGTASGGSIELGGNALLVINAEARVPIYRWLNIAGFLDAGNIFEEVADLRIGDLQTSVGFGVRVDSPVGLFRLDLGVPINRRSGDSSWRLHFGIGQAF